MLNHIQVGVISPNFVETTFTGSRKFVKLSASKASSYIPKYWRELNLAVEPKIAIARILADLNSAVRYMIAIRMYVE